MTRRTRGLVALAATTVALAAPDAAFAHAYLVKTVPAASVTLNTPPSTVALTYDEAVEPRFALVSVTDAAARRETTGPARRAPGNPDTLVVPLRPHLAEGWYLVIWRAISVDGHPVQGAFTFAVGPNPGPQPQFVIPKISGTATAKRLLFTRWLVFLTVMAAIGLFVLRMMIARPMIRAVAGTSLRAVSIAFIVTAALGLLAIPVYLDVATAVDSLHSVFAVGSLVPLFRVTAFGRGYVDLELCFALFVAAALVALWVDRPERERRSIAEIVAIAGALFAAAAVLIVPGLTGHAAQTSPRGFSLLFDWLHLSAASLWLGGLTGLLVLGRSLPAVKRVAGLIICVPRFSNVAFVSVLLLLGSGTAATVLHMPILAALWQTSYGKTILVKIGILAVAMVLGAVNLLRTKPGLVSARETPQRGTSAAVLLRRAISVETVLLVGAVFAAAVLTSLAPPPAAFAKEATAAAHVGPGRVAATLHQNGYELRLLVDPNRAAAPNSFALELTKNGIPVRGANVTLSFAMLDMEMPNQEYQLKETRPGVYVRNAPALVMVGHWALSFEITPPGGTPFVATLVDHASG
jgi:copper transport protein